MADETVGFVIPAERVEGDLPKKRGGRPKGSKNRTSAAAPAVRHDIPAAGPVDGDYDKLTLENQQPGMVYFRANQRDMHSLKRWGAVEEKWHFDKDGNPTNAYPREWFEPGKPGETVRMEELTILKLPVERNNQRVAADRRRHDHKQRIDVMMAPVAAGMGNFQATTVGLGSGDFTPVQG